LLTQLTNLSLVTFVSVVPHGSSGGGNLQITQAGIHKCGNVCPNLRLALQAEIALLSPVNCSTLSRKGVLVSSSREAAIKMANKAQSRISSQLAVELRQAD